MAAPSDVSIKFIPQATGVCGEKPRRSEAVVNVVVDGVAWSARVPMPDLEEAECWEWYRADCVTEAIEQ